MKFRNLERIGERKRRKEIKCIKVKKVSMSKELK